MFEYTKKWSTETDTSAPGRIRNATEFWKTAPQLNRHCQINPKEKEERFEK
jgi:hypothetical protein